MISVFSSSTASYFVPGVTAPIFIQPAHGDDNFRRPDAPDLSRADLLPAFPSAEDAAQESAWNLWQDWHLAVSLLPERDTVNGEYFDLRDIVGCVGTCYINRFSCHVQRLYPNWEGRYRFRLVHVLRVVKCYLRDGHKRHSRAELIRRVREKQFG